MQVSFGFVAGDVAAWRALLGPVALPRTRRAPVGQLVKSMISARTRDAVSLAAYRRLGERFGSAAHLAAAEPAAVARVIGDVTFADAKAVHLVAALRMIVVEDGGFGLDHLAARPLGEALAWLERLPGVARKVSASTLNASTLGRPVMIVDTHVLRVLQRLGFVHATADYRAASEAVTAAMPGWAGDDFLGFHIALKRLGQDVCRWDAPDCGRCPLAGACPVARIDIKRRWRKRGPVRLPIRTGDEDRQTMTNDPRPDTAAQDARAITLALLARRAADATICPSEVARAIAAAGGTDWRGAMPGVHAAVDGLVADGLVRLSWKGAALAVRKGPYRIGRPQRD